MPPGDSALLTRLLTVQSQVVIRDVYHCFAWCNLAGSRSLAANPTAPTVISQPSCMVSASANLRVSAFV